MRRNTWSSSLAAGAASATLLLAAIALADDPIVIGPDTLDDARIAQEGLFGISLGILMPCVQEHMEAAEAPDAAESACFCEHRADIDARLAPIRDVLTRRPEWKGKVLEIHEGEDTLRIDLENVNRIELRTAGCTR